MKAIEKKRDFRGEVIAFLQLLADPELHQEKHFRVPPEEIPSLLCKLWFEEVYPLGASYVDAVKGDSCESLSKEFCRCFSEEELKVLDRFHRFLELRIEMLPRSGDRLANDRLKKFYGSNKWGYIIRDARNTLWLLEQPQSD